MKNYKLISLTGKKINSSFNDARKSNVSVDSCEIMKRKYQEQFESLNKEIENTSDQISELEARNGDLQFQVSEGLQTRNDYSERDQKKIDRQIFQLGKNIQKNTNMIHKKQNKLNDLYEQKSALEEQFLSSSDTDTLKDTIAKEISSVPVHLSQQADPVKNFQISVQNFIDQIRQNDDKNNEKIYILEIENQSLKEDNERLKKQNESLKKENTQLTDETSDYHKVVVAKINEANASIQKQNQASKNLVSQLNKKDQEIAELKKVVAEKNQELLKVNQQFKQFTKTIQQVDNNQTFEPSSSSNNSGTQYTKHE